MLTYLRYGLATVCFALSVGCLALWWRSTNCWDILENPNGTQPGRGRIVQAVDGMALVELDHTYNFDPNEKRLFVLSSHPANYFRKEIGERISTHGRFYVRGMTAHFPLWYPALLFALAGVAALRLGRRFTVRSAIIATTAVAGLLGMAAGL